MRALIRRHWLKLVAVGVAVIGVAVVAVVAFLSIDSAHDLITRANFDQVATGMTIEQVEAILGPPGKYGGPPFGTRAHAFGHLGDGNAKFTAKKWEGEEGMITVTFVDGRVTEKFFDSAESLMPPD